MDNPEIVDIGLCQMLSLVVDHDLDAELDVFSSVSIEFWCFYQWFSVYQVKALFFLGGGGGVSIVQVYLIGGFDDASPNVRPKIPYFVLNFPDT